jgi:predicted anti-sigma-YlaC factor YlaD
MNGCQDIRPQLDELIDGTLDDVTAARVWAHLAGCDTCRAEHTNLVAARARLYELAQDAAPPRDLWPQLAARLATAAPVVRPRTGWQRRTWQLPQVGVLVAAAVVALMVIVPPLQRMQRSSHPLARDLGTLDATYQDVRSDLGRILDAGCEKLPRQTCADVKTSVEVLDETAAAVHAALQDHAASPRETLLLVNNYQLTIDRARGLANRLARI